MRTGKHETLYYRWAGSAEVTGPQRSVVILHGLFGSGENWAGIARALSEHVPVVLPDLPNHGKSAWTETIDYPTMAREVERLISLLGLEQPIVVGHSMGGKVAMALALMQPESVGGLGVIDIAPRRYRPSHESILAAMAAVEERGNKEGRSPTRTEADAILAERIPDQAVRGFLLKSYRRTSESNYGWMLNVSGIRTAYSAILGFPDFGAAQYTGKALFLYGSESDYVRTERDNELIWERFPQAQLVEVDGAGHWVHAVQPKRVVSELMALVG